MAIEWRQAIAGAAVGAGVSITTTLALLQRYLQKEVQVPRLFHKASEKQTVQDERVVEEVRNCLKDYWPHPVLEFSGYISSAWCGFLAILPTKWQGHLETVTLADGGTVSLHWSEEPCDAGSTDPIVLVLPGLNNDSRTGFIQNILQQLRMQGFRGVALNYRGVGGQPLLSPRLGASDSWQDLPTVFEHITCRYPGSQIFAIGFSMGAAILLRHLGNEGSNTRITAGVAIAAPVDFPAVVTFLESTLRKRGMNFMIASGIKLFMGPSLVRSQFRDQVNMWKTLRATSVRQIDEAVICPLHNYRDSDHYYDYNSPHKTLSNIAVPTLIINAADDPVISFKSIPVDDVERNPNLYLVVTHRGGHIGWGGGGVKDGDQRIVWTDYVSLRFLKAHCQPFSNCRHYVRSRL